MAITSDSGLTQEQFGELLDVHGGDIGRWPGDVRAAAQRLVARDPQAAKLLAEAQALDKVLALAPRTEATPGLLDRIVTQAKLEAQVAPSQPPASDRRAAGNVVVLPVPRRAASGKPGDGALHGGGMPAAGWQMRVSQMAGAGSMLAASLLIGIWLGASGAAGTGFAGSFQPRQTALATEAMSEILHSALPLELLESSDEETL